MNASTLSALALSLWPLLEPESYNDARAEVSASVKKLIGTFPEKGGIVRIGDRYVVGSDKAAMSRALAIVEGSGATSAFKVIGSALVTKGWTPVVLSCDYMHASSTKSIVAVNSNEESSLSRDNDFWSGKNHGVHAGATPRIGAIHTYYEVDRPSAETSASFAAQATNNGVVKLDAFRDHKVYLNIAIQPGAVLIVKGNAAVYNREYMLAEPLWARIKNNPSIKQDEERAKITLPLSPDYLFDNVQIFSSAQGSALDGGLSGTLIQDTGGLNFSVVGLENNVFIYSAKPNVDMKDIL